MGEIPERTDFLAEGMRIVPPAAVRTGTFIGKNVVVMPSYVNIGAYVDEGTMIDTWASVGSCAQVGKNCHISGGAGIGGHCINSKYRNYVIQGNIILLCQGMDMNASYRNCEKLLNLLIKPR